MRRGEGFRKTISSILILLFLGWASLHCRHYHGHDDELQKGGPSFLFVASSSTALLQRQQQRRNLHRRRRANHHHHHARSSLHHDLQQSESIHEHQRRLINRNITDPKSALTAWRALRRFLATRHLSRYEYAHRKQYGLELFIGWNGIYNETAPSILNEESSSSAAAAAAAAAATYSYYSFFQSSHHRNLEMNVSNWISNVGPVVDNYQSVPLSQGYGTHLANVWVGSPHPQRKTVIVDTGSHFTAFPCHGCRNCGGAYHTDPYFDPRKSETYHQLQCEECLGVMCDEGRCLFSQSYTEGSSWDAIQVKDQFYCGGLDVLDAVEPKNRKYAINFMFGCMTKVNGLFLTQLADGIMGMSAHEATLTKQLWNWGTLEHNMFALCFRRELGTSKRGVPAGSMTLGGASTNLDSSPVVYAKNMAKSGWFTVYVKNIFVRAGGGQSAKFTPGTRTVRVGVDLASLNSGKGVIVDSGTTDTYLNKAVGPAFRRAWKMATGKPYSHFPTILTDEELSRLPTILVQCHAYAAADPAVEDYDSIPGYVGSLDPTSPNDLLIAIPATSYMDYSPITKMYTSRLYLTESQGGVLGSNTMQGHNVVFDWRLGRIGFSESSCTYDKDDLPADLADDEGYPADCVVHEPILTTPCSETVEKSICDLHPTNVALLGVERWTALVESPGSSAGLQCKEVAGGSVGEAEGDKRKVECLGDGVCEEERPCQLTCSELERVSKVFATPMDNDRLGCGDSYWSACDSSCRQTRIHSMAYSDGLCHEEERQTRECNMGVCMRDSPCRIPYLLHAVLGFSGLRIRDWTYTADDIVSQALVRTAAQILGEKVFEEGDVNVVFSLPWYLDEDNPESALQYKSTKIHSAGVKVVIDISIVNRSYNKTSVEVVEDEDPGTFENLFPNWTVHNGQIIRCSEKDLHSLAKTALHLKKNVLNAPNFMPMLLRKMKLIEAENRRRSAYFEPMYSNNTEKSSSRLIAAWSVPTGVDEDINYFGPHRPVWYILVRFLHIGTIVLMIAMLLWSVGGVWLSVPMRDICLRLRFRWRRQRYSPVSTVDREDEIENPDDNGAMMLELAVHSPDRYRNGPVFKRKGSQQSRNTAHT